VIKIDGLHDEVNAATNQPTGKIALFVSDSIAVFNSPVTINC
jgi:hypothetical protein